MSETQLQQSASHRPKKNRQSTFFQSFSSSIIDKGQKFTLDKTLVKGIKQNDPSKIVQNGQEADLGQTANLYDEEKQVNDILVNMRKKYDQVKQNTNKIEQAIERMKKEKQNLEDEKQKVELMFKGQQNEFKRIQAQIEKWNSMCDSAQYDKEIRAQINETLKQDILFYKKNCFEANIKIVRNHNHVKTLTCQVQSSNKVSTNCRSLIYSIDNKILQKQTVRGDKINSYYDILNKKIQNNQKREQRQKMIENSMLQALYGKMPEQQQQKKVLLMNLALKKMLKQKIQREMQRFSETQTSFRKIQQNTSVKRADQFIDRFIKRQRNYGQLLQSISKSEQKIAKLRLQKEFLQKQHNEMMYNKQTIEDLEMEKKGHHNLVNSMNVDLLRERLICNEMLKNKTFSFVTKFLSAFDNKNINHVKQKYSRQKPDISLKQALWKVSKYLTLIEKEQKECEFAQKLNKIYIESKDLNLPSGAKSRNLRIKTLTTRQDTQNSVMEDHDIAYDDRSERDYLNQNRKQIKKSAYLRNRLKTKA